MKWFQIKEKSAGEKRLLLTYYIYKIFGRRAVNIIAFFVALITFLSNPELRRYTKKYFEVLYEFSKDKKFKPNFKNEFKQVLSYSYSLMDKMEIFMGKFDPKNIIFTENNVTEEMYSDIKSKGVFFLCNHIGNIEALRSLLHSKEYPIHPNITIFMQKKQCEIFNSFIKKISEENKKVKVYPIEDIDVLTAVELEDDMSNEGIAIMAGDRIPKDNSDKTSKGILLNKKIEIPIGVFKFIKTLKKPTYFVSCIKDNKKYKVYFKKVNLEEEIEEIQRKYLNFTEQMILKAPYQFYHFYDFFEEE